MQLFPSKNFRKLNNPGQVALWLLSSAYRWTVARLSLRVSFPCTGFNNADGHKRGLKPGSGKQCSAATQGLVWT